MKHARNLQAPVLALLVAALVFTHGDARAQNKEKGPNAGKRLSEWLLEQPVDPNAYPLGLSWRVPGEVAAQLALRRDLLAAIRASNEADPAAAARLRDWIVTLPVTGRVPVALADARWLQANPKHDPVIAPNDRVVLPQRPRTVTVVTQSGARCSVPHAAGFDARAYLEACDPEHADSADWAWIAQPDGSVQRFGIAIWNGGKQDEPAPGAWIWGPSRASGWSKAVGADLIRRPIMPRAPRTNRGCLQRLPRGAARACACRRATGA